MKVIAIVALVSSMIAGILGDCVGPEPDQAQNKEQERIINLHDLTTRFDTYLLGQIYLHFQETTVDGKTKWKIIAPPNVDSAAVEIVETFLNSLLALWGEGSRLFQAAHNASQGRLNSAIEMACYRFTAANSLLANLEHDLKPWWTPEQRTSADVVRDIATALLQYTCQNNGSRILDFYAADGDVCLNSSFAEILTHFMTSYSNNTYFLKGPDHSRPINVLWANSILTVDDHYCRNTERFQNSTVEVLKRCQNQTASYEINNWFNIIKQSSGCDDLLNAQITTATDN